MESLAPEGMWIGRSISLCYPGVVVLLGKNVPHGWSQTRPSLCPQPGDPGEELDTDPAQRLCVILTAAITGQCSYGQQAKPPTSTCVGQSRVISLENEITLLSCPRCKLMVLYSFFSSSPDSDGAETRFAPCCSFCRFFFIIIIFH